MSDTDIPLQHSVLGTFLLPIAQALRLQGLDPLDTMAQVDIDGAKIANPDWRLAYDQFNSLMGHCVVTDARTVGLIHDDRLVVVLRHDMTPGRWPDRPLLLVWSDGQGKSSLRGHGSASFV